MHDSISMEERGVPSVLVCTEPFTATVKAIARIRGVPERPFVAVPHPVASLDDAALTRLASTIADRVETQGVSATQPARARAGEQPAR